MKAKSDPPGSPPWLWAYLLVYIASTVGSTIPWFVYLGSSFQNFLHGNLSAGQLVFGQFLEISGFIIAFLGILTVLLPHLRGWWVERHYGLTKLTSHSSVISEIEEFLSQYRSPPAVTVSFQRPFLAFVYPASYTAFRVGIGAGFLKLWRSKREDAEAILLHELAHFRRGDTRIIGVGSFLEVGFRLILRVSFYGLLLFAFLNFIGVFVQFLLAGAQSHTTGILFWLNAAVVLLQVIIGMVVEILKIAANSVLWIVAIVLATWSAEFNADWLASDYQGKPDFLINNLQKPQIGQKRFRFMYLLTHPPDWLRQWFLRQKTGIAAGWLLLLFPLGYLLIYMFITGLYGMAYAVQNALGGLPKEQVTLLFVYSLGQLSQYLLWLLPIYAVIILIWPFVCGLWEKLMTSDRRAISWGSIYVNMICGMLLFAITFLGGKMIYPYLASLAGHLTLAMGLALPSSVSQTLYFPSQQVEVKPVTALSSDQRITAASLLTNANDSTVVLLVFRQTELSPVRLANVSTPVTLAFINEQGEITEFQNLMPSNALVSKKPSRQYRFVLLGSQSWFRSYNFQVGDQVELKGWPPTSNCANFLYFYMGSCK